MQNFESKLVPWTILYYLSTSNIMFVHDLIPVLTREYPKQYPTDSLVTLLKALPAAMPLRQSPSLGSSRVWLGQRPSEGTTPQQLFFQAKAQQTGMKIKSS